MKREKIIIGITQGDINGVGYEIIIKSLQDKRILDLMTPVIYGSKKFFDIYKSGIQNLMEDIDVVSIDDISQIQDRKINILECNSENITLRIGECTPEGSQAALTALSMAMEDLHKGNIQCIVTAPINKREMNMQGFHFNGHTEFLEAHCGGKKSCMLMISHRLRVGMVTGHITLKDVSSALSIDGIVEKLAIMNSSLIEDFCIDKPRLAVLSLNPHCSDHGLLGCEEEEIIIPAITKAHEQGIDAFGPYSADGFFASGSHSKFDAILAMYHDQGLIPFKTIAFDDGVNFTAGLELIRTSPAHGTAYNIAGKDLANHNSMLNAIYSVIDIWHNRKAYKELIKNKMPEQELVEHNRHNRSEN